MQLSISAPTPSTGLADGGLVISRCCWQQTYEQHWLHTRGLQAVIERGMQAHCWPARAAPWLSQQPLADTWLVAAWEHGVPYIPAAGNALMHWQPPGKSSELATRGPGGRGKQGDVAASFVTRRAICQLGRGLHQARRFSRDRSPRNHARHNAISVGATARDWRQSSHEGVGGERRAVRCEVTT